MNSLLSFFLVPLATLLLCVLLLIALRKRLTLIARLTIAIVVSIGFFIAGNAAVNIIANYPSASHLAAIMNEFSQDNSFRLLDHNDNKATGFDNTVPSYTVVIRICRTSSRAFFHI